MKTCLDAGSHDQAVQVIVFDHEEAQVAWKTVQNHGCSAHAAFCARLLDKHAGHRDIYNEDGDERGGTGSDAERRRSTGYCER